MAKLPFENGAQLRFDLIDGKWRYAVFGPEKPSGQPRGLAGTLVATYPTLDDAISAFKAEYDVP